MDRHYYSRSRSKEGALEIISDYIRGVTVEFFVKPGVFSKRGIDVGTKLLIENAVVPEEGTILDLGCGYGVIGITLAKVFPKIKVIMVDINPVAVKLAQMNIRHNGVEDRVEVYQGDLYEPVRGIKFDAIITNPPLAAGLDTVSRIIVEAPQYLKDRGLLEMVLRKGENTILRKINEIGLTTLKIYRKKGYTILVAINRDDPYRI